MTNLHKTLSLFIVISISYASLIFGMKEITKNIRDHQNQKFQIFLQKELSKKPMDQHIAFFENKLQLLQERVQKQENRLYEAIKRELEISDDMWQGYNELTELFKKKEQERLLLPLEDAVHDENMPSYIKQMLIKKLEQKGINSKRINLKYVDNVPSNTLSLAFRCSLTAGKYSKGKVIFAKSIPGLIQIHSGLFTEAICTILVEGIARQFSINDDMLFSCFSKDTIQKNPSFQTMSQNYFYIASLYAALYNQQTALLMQTYWKKVIYHTDNLDNNLRLRYFKWQAKIKRYWDCITWLQEYGIKTKTL